MADAWEEIKGVADTIMPGSGTFLDTVLTGGVSEVNEANKAIADARNVFEAEQADKAREFSSDEASILRSFQADQISKQLNFQDYMSSSAVQRRMADMKNAGINPILAGKYDASTPAGGAATGGMPSTAKANAHGYEAQNRVMGAMNMLNSAMDLQQKQKNIAKTSADTANTLQNMNIKKPGSTFATDADNVYKGFKQFANDVAPAVGGFISNSAKSLENAVKALPNAMEKGKEEFTKYRGELINEKAKYNPLGTGYHINIGGQ